ncbi:MAG TPA: thiamine pyrophosphate-binding protein, partial [Xanthobacteraceae bacterium]|nr:thiamine pyrophosphate-binding protein [Xanthobacteraceae bacterium]
MARKDKSPQGLAAKGRDLSRRKFMAGVALTGAATAVSPQDPAHAAAAPEATTDALPARLPSALRPNAQMAAAETGTPKELGKATGPDGSDFMVDVIKTLNIDYVFSNPASSFRALHESLIDYGSNKKPEFITCMHEESSVGMAHGYFKATGKLGMMLCHGTVGLQHATMAIYNAWCDRVPLIAIGGNDLDAAYRAPGVPTYHSAQDINAIVRDFTKWDDQPVSLQHFAQSFVRAYKIAMTPPHEPVMIALDLGLQQEPVKAHERETLYIPKYVPTAPPQADTGAVREAARLLANAERPVIVADRAARTPAGTRLLVQLAEALQAPVIDQGGRMNMPNTHYLNQTARNAALINNADVIIGL